MNQISNRGADRRSQKARLKTLEVEHKQLRNYTNRCETAGQKLLDDNQKLVIACQDLMGSLEMFKATNKQLTEENESMRASYVELQGKLDPSFNAPIDDVLHEEKPLIITV